MAINLKESPMVRNLKKPAALSLATTTARWPRKLRTKVTVNTRSGTSYWLFQPFKTSVEFILRFTVGPFLLISTVSKQYAHPPHWG